MEIKHGPLLGEIGILALVYHDWGPIWMTPHHILTRLGRYFHVVWLEPPHGWREIRQSVKKRRRQDVTGSLAIPSGFQLYVPEPWLPQFFRLKSLAAFTFQQRVKRGMRRLKAAGCKKLILYLWHPDFEPAVRLDGFDLKLYHIDDEYSFSATSVGLEPTELRVLRCVDQVFIVSPSLMAVKGGINPHTAFLPEGVDYHLYTTRTVEPEDLASIPHPRVGYTGILKKQLNWGLLWDLAVRHSEWSFVFVGPPLWHHNIGESIKQMSSLRNVYFLGAKPVNALASYTQHFDVCIMPYRVNAYTNNIYPLKLHEYLASGRPVVSSPIRSMRNFADVIELAEGAEDWSRALTKTLNPCANSRAAMAARQKIARGHDWGCLVSSVARTICERLGSQCYKEFTKRCTPFADVQDLQLKRMGLPIPAPVIEKPYV